MGRLRRIGSLSLRGVGLILSVLMLLAFIGSVPRLAMTVLAPVLGPERIELPQAGLAVSLSRDWEHESATVYNEDWWDPSHGTPAQQHDHFLDSGGVLRARKPAPTEAGHEQCYLYTLSGAEAQELVNSADDDPRAVKVETQHLELPGGSAIAVDVLHGDDFSWRDYLVTSGDRWLQLECGSISPPGDRWLPIAESLEFLPEWE